ncbi:putative ABC transport system ATP-binding protein [Lactobacillus colini]|uniref:ABC transport system ATP-binding protein n=1 Tax=Lactobacillus colini TaxID=1819254 RepID=A0ABS4MGI2_9LACO|nr:ABC transporter ATP-binding protein [Lactobacillus colini]MBP2058809.1 putative ABC transport system ATP-binding protein [Lactobacillus colini]
MHKNALEVCNLNKKFGSRTIFQNLSFTINSGEFVAIVGPSGCGKSTLLNILGLLETADQGKILLFNKELPPINSKQATLLRRNVINYLFQSFALITNKTVKDNLLLAMHFIKNSNANKEHLISNVLNELDISHLINEQISSLSGGEQQRVALARAILKPGNLVLADEPTGALDEQRAQLAFKQIEKLRSQYGKTILMVTHNLQQARQCDRIINLADL